jgi:hypothetical protein
MKRPALALLGLAVALATPVFAAPDRTIEIAVTVLDEAGDPLAGADVRVEPVDIGLDSSTALIFREPGWKNLEGWHWSSEEAPLATATTDARGFASLTVKNAWGLRVTAAHAGHATARRYGIPEGDSVLEVRLPPEAIIQGRVVDPSGAAVASAEVTLDEPDHSKHGIVPVAARTAADGTFTAHGFAKGPHRVTVRALDASFATTTFPVEAPLADAPTLALERAATIAVDVVVPAAALRADVAQLDTAGVGQAWLGLFRVNRDDESFPCFNAWEGFTLAVVGDDRLRLTLPDVTPGSYAISFENRRCGDTLAVGPAGPVTVKAERGLTATTQLVLPLGRRLRGRVVDGSGKPVGNASICWSFGTFTSHTTTPESGTFDFPVGPDDEGSLGIETPAGRREISVERTMTDLGDVVLR